MKEEEPEAALGGRQTRKRQRAADAEDAAFDSEADEDAEAGCGRRGGDRRKGVAAKEQKKLNEKARRQRENDL